MRSSSSLRSFPTRSVRLIEPFGRGGGPDEIARALARELVKLWAQPVGVENHPGAGSTAAPNLVAKAAPDGYTLLVTTSAQAYSSAVPSGLPYDPLHDFVAIAPLTSQPYVLVVGRRAGISTLGELLAAAAAKPDELTFGSTGVGTATHIGLEKMNLQAGVRAVHVPAQGGDSIVETIAKTADGLTTYAMSPISIASPLIREGRLRALGITTTRRSNLLPEVPTIAEAGLAGYDHPIWYGMWARAGTPPDVIKTIARDVARALTVPGLQAWIEKHGAHPMAMSQAAFAAFVLSEAESAARIVASAQ